MCDCSVSTLVPPLVLCSSTCCCTATPLTHFNPCTRIALLLSSLHAPHQPESCACNVPGRHACAQLQISQSVCLPCDHASSRLPDGHGHPTLSSGAACVMYDPGSHGCRPLLSTCQSARLRLSAVHKFLPTFSCPCRTTSIPIIPLDPSMVAYMSRAGTTREQEKRQSSS